MKKIIIILVAVMGSLFVSGQTNHEFSIHGGGGLSSLNYKLSSGKCSNLFGGDFGLGYTCIFNDVVALHFGIDFDFYNAKAKLDGVQIITSNLKDSENDRFDMCTTLNNYTETQKAMFLNIPVMLQLQTKGKHKAFARAGIKIGIPLNCKYNVTDATLTNEAYYTALGTWLPVPEFAGFGIFPNQNFDGKLKLNVTAMIALEAGAKWKLGEMLALYTGIYFDYGLNNSLKKSNKPFINYSNSYPATFTANSALPSLTEKIKPIAVGFKLRFGFDVSAAIAKAKLEREKAAELERERITLERERIGLQTLIIDYYIKNSSCDSSQIWSSANSSKSSSSISSSKSFKKSLSGLCAATNSSGLGSTPSDKVQRG